jgi:DNA-directed RNA polymerase subunit RPC12/RpoP
MSTLSEEEKILAWFMEEKEYLCTHCGTKLLSTFDERGCPCPSCGRKMLSPEEVPRVYICPACGYMSWVELEEGELPMCDTCGYDLSRTKYVTHDRLVNGGVNGSPGEK